MHVRLMLPALTDQAGINCEVECALHTAVSMHLASATLAIDSFAKVVPLTARILYCPGSSQSSLTPSGSTCSMISDDSFVTCSSSNQADFTEPSQHGASGASTHAQCCPGGMGCTMRIGSNFRTLKCIRASSGPRQKHCGRTWASRSCSAPSFSFSRVASASSSSLSMRCSVQIRQAVRAMRG
jgi:hypothetical protein